MKERFPYVLASFFQTLHIRLKSGLNWSWEKEGSNEVEVEPCKLELYAIIRHHIKHAFSSFIISSRTQHFPTVN